MPTRLPSRRALRPQDRISRPAGSCGAPVSSGAVIRRRRRAGGRPRVAGDPVVHGSHAPGYPPLRSCSRLRLERHDPAALERLSVEITADLRKPRMPMGVEVSETRDRRLARGHPEGVNRALARRPLTPRDLRDLLLPSGALPPQADAFMLHEARSDLRVVDAVPLLANVVDTHDVSLYTRAEVRPPDREARGPREDRRRRGEEDRHRDEREADSAHTCLRRRQHELQPDALGAECRVIEHDVVGAPRLDFADLEFGDRRRADIVIEDEMSAMRVPSSHTSVMLAAPLTSRWSSSACQPGPMTVSSSSWSPARRCAVRADRSP